MLKNLLIPPTSLFTLGNLFSLMLFFVTESNCHFSIGHNNEGHFEVIAFDSYGTLLDVTSVTQQRLLEQLPLSPQLASQFVSHWRQKQLSYTYLRTLMDRYVNFWKVTNDAFENTLSTFELYNLTKVQKSFQMNSWLNLKAFPDVEPALRRLKSSARFKLVILSNGSPGMIEAGMRNANLTQYFDSIISVDSIRKFKPHPQVYKLIEQELCVPRSRILFVSSNSWDSIGATNIGLTSVWINRSTSSVNNSPIIDNLGLMPNYVFTDMNQIAKYFDKK